MYNYNFRATYRTKTYIAGDWTGDSDAIEQLYKWNDSKYWSLHFIDAHDLTQAKDSSLNCSIKASLKTRLDASKTFVLQPKTAAVPQANTTSTNVPMNSAMYFLIEFI